MGSRSLALSRWVLIIAFLGVGLAGETCNAKDESTNCTSSCGNIHNITYPFRLKHDPKHCGNVGFTLSCENNVTLVDLPSAGRYYVQAINYDYKTIRLLDPGLQNKNCSSMPQNFPPTLRGPYPYYFWSLLSIPIFYIMCSNPMNSSLYVKTAPCLNTSATSLVHQKTYSYVKVEAMEVGDLNEGCSAEWVALALLNYSKDYNTSYESIHSALMYGFDLGFWPYVKMCQGQWSTNSKCFPHTIPGLFGYICERIYGFFSRGWVYFDIRKNFPINITYHASDAGFLKTIRALWFPLICFGLFF